MLNGARAETFPCRTCDGSGPELFRKRGFPIAECRACGTRFVPSSCLEPVLYDEQYFAGANGSGGYASYLEDRDLVLANFARRVRWLKRLAEGPRLLDVGAAYGFLLVAARAERFEPLGVEPVAACVDYARNELGVQVVCGRVEDVELRDESFDVVTMFDVIEHLEEPVRVLRRVRAALRRGGLLVVETGDLEALLSRVSGPRWYFYDPPQHVTFFGRRSLARLLEREGFSPPVAIEHLGRAVSLRNFAYQLGRALGPGLAGNLSRAVARSSLGRVRFCVPDRGNAFALAARRLG